jgi:hypothetical protein
VKCRIKFVVVIIIIIIIIIVIIIIWLEDILMLFSLIYVVVSFLVLPFHFVFKASKHFLLSFRQCA